MTRSYLSLYAMTLEILPALVVPGFYIDALVLFFSTDSQYLKYLLSSLEFMKQYCLSTSIHNLNPLNII